MMLSNIQKNLNISANKINVDKLKRRSYRHATLICKLFWRHMKI